MICSSPPEVRERLIAFRVTSAEKAEMEILAARMGLSLSELIRQSIEFVYRRDQAAQAEEA